jgi:hypothetical protein
MLTTAVAVVPATAVATVLAARRPRNPIGWLLLAILIVGFNPSSQYIVLDYRMHHGTLPLDAFQPAHVSVRLAPVPAGEQDRMST